MWEVNRSQKNNDTLLEEEHRLRRELERLSLDAEVPYWMGVKADIDEARIMKVHVKKKLEEVKKKLSEG